MNPCTVKLVFSIQALFPKRLRGGHHGGAPASPVCRPRRPAASEQMSPLESHQPALVSSPRHVFLPRDRFSSSIGESTNTGVASRGIGSLLPIHFWGALREPGSGVPFLLIPAGAALLGMFWSWRGVPGRAQMASGPVGGWLCGNLGWRSRTPPFLGRISPE